MKCGSKVRIKEEGGKAGKSAFVLMDAILSLALLCLVLAFYIPGMVTLMAQRKAYELGLEEMRLFADLVKVAHQGSDSLANVEALYAGDDRLSGVRYFNCNDQGCEVIFDNGDAFQVNKSAEP